MLHFLCTFSSNPALVLLSQEDQSGGPYCQNEASVLRISVTQLLRNKLCYVSFCMLHFSLYMLHRLCEHIKLFLFFDTVI